MFWPRIKAQSETPAGSCLVDACQRAVGAARITKIFTVADRNED
ncbi:hypothetical protein NBRC111894_324 [Sporolactobacillus inulinus]|uniref:Uncharacterized protein n=1 Tax=Sporolactobacillus inulinus TaxID=2078 RepID=A0A4Y1Z6W5_9BACL|nr:hypothetical protein NBRC111894_324 [Sporolactobacillus inulinus]